MTTSTCSIRPRGQIADERALGQLPARDAGAHRELCGVLELALARMQVQVDPPDRGAVTEHVVRDDVLVPQRHVGGPVVDAEQPAGHVEQTGAHGGEIEVRPDALGVDLVALAADERLEVVAVRGVQRRLARVVAASPFEQDVVVALRRLGGVGSGLVDELEDGLAAADHLDLGVVVGPVGIAEQLRLLVPQVENLLQYGVIHRPTAVECGEGEVLAHGGVPRERPYRDEVRRVGRQLDQLVVADRMGVDEVRREPVELVGPDPDRTDVVADPAAEVLVEHGEPLRYRAQAVAHLVRPIDAGAAEVA